jgi:hypothetical protein
MKKQTLKKVVNISWIAKFFLLSCFVLLGSMRGFSQAATGKLTGRITDATTNEKLYGASISVKGTKFGTPTQSDGSYLLVLPVGTYTISISMNGYASQEISGIEIKKGETTSLPIVLSPAAKAIDTVVVSVNVRRATQAALYNLQRRQSAAGDGISIEAIAKTPDNNVGQISKRITGVSVQENRFVVVRGLAEQYNQTILNGVPMTSTETDRNAFSLDLIPAVVVENIIVNKTATPDMPGNFAGGLVQVNTKDFPTDNFLSVTVQSSFFDQTIGKDFYSDKRDKLEWLGLGGNIRDLPKGFPSPTSRTPLVSLNAQERVRYLSMLPNNLAPINNGASKPNYSVQLGYGKSFRFENKSQLGIVAAITQRRSELIEQEVTARPLPIGVGGNQGFEFFNYYSENIRYNFESSLGGALNIAYRFGTSRITLSNLYSNIFRNVFLDRPFADIEAFDVLGNGPGLRVAGTTHFIDERRILNNILSGEHRTGNRNETIIQWNVNTSIYSTGNPDTRNFVYKKVDSSGFLLGNNNASIGQALSTQSRLWSNNTDFIFGGAFNTSTVFKLFSQKQVFKSGILFQTRKRKAEGLLVPYYAPQGILDSLLSPTNIYPGGPLDYTTSIAAIAGQVGNYNAGSSLKAFYESIENNFGKNLRVVWGLRIENYHQYVNVFQPFFFDNFQQPDLLLGSFTSRNNFNFLPSVNVIYNLTDNFTLRAAYSATVIRPELKDLAPFQSYDFRTLQITQGNPELRSTSINNYDLKLEYFPVAGEILSLSGYYKKITDPIEKVPGIDNNAAIRPLNTGKATVYGIEGEIRKRLSFIPFAPWLGNVTLFGNASLIKSKVEAGPLNNFTINQVTEHTLSGQPNYIVNAGISILAFKKSFEFTFSYNRSGDFITQLGTFNETKLPNGNTTPTSPHFYIRGRDLADIVFTQSVLNKKGRIKFNISNLFNARFMVYQDLNGNGKFDSAATVDKTKTDHRIVGGLDSTPSSIVPQRSYSLSFTYTFNQ